jgi:hypothetical protein
MLPCLVFGAGRHAAIHIRPVFLAAAVCGSAAIWFGLIEGLLTLLKAIS